MMKVIAALILIILGSCVHAQSGLRPLDTELRNYEYPFKVDFIEIGSQKQVLFMAYMDIKPAKSNGKNIMLLHGKNFNGAYWKTTIDALTDVGYRVIVPDQIGFGKSSKPKDYQYSFQQLAANTKMILDSLGIRKTAVLGHSMGGMLATRFALMYPEITEKLILENPIGLEDYKTLTPYAPIDLNYKNELKNTYESYKDYQLKFYYDNKWKPEYDEWLYLLAGWTLDDNYSIIAWSAAKTTDMIITQPVVYEFENLLMPTLLIIGTRDRTALGKAQAKPEVQEQMGRYDRLGKTTAAKIKTSKLVELDGIGHLPHIEAFEKFMTPLKIFLRER